MLTLDQLNSLSIGDKVFTVEERNNFFNRTKLSMTYLDKTWYRYEPENIIDSSVEEIFLKGRLISRIEGEYPSQESYDELYFVSEDNKTRLYVDTTYDYNDLYLTREEAESAIVEKD